MQERSKGYAHLYSGVYFAPHASPPVRATGLEQAAFWTGTALMWLLVPITLPAVVFLARRVPRGAPAR